MNHTSGIPDYYETGYYESHDTSAAMPQNSDLVRIMSLFPDPDFAPGERYVYNNAAYEVLVTIIENLSGTDFRSFVKDRVFTPAGMPTATTFNSATPDIPNRVYGYSPADDGFEIDDYDPFNDMLGAGGVYATLRDFAAWSEALDDNAVFAASALRQAHSRATLNDGKIIDYGFGWRLDQYRGHTRTAHGGSWVGFRTGIARYPEETRTCRTSHRGPSWNTTARCRKTTSGGRSPATRWPGCTATRASCSRPSRCTATARFANSTARR
jgi:CubicO group peptidase (beta-lactamase class C family)